MGSAVDGVQSTFSEPFKIVGRGNRMVDMKHVFFLYALAVCGLPATLFAQSGLKETQFVGSVERLDEAINELIAEDAKTEVLATGFSWSEGPVWVKADGGFVIFSDVPQNTIWRWDETNLLKKYLNPSGFTGIEGHGGESGSNGLAIDAKGRLVLCQHGDRRVARMKTDVSQQESEFETIAGKCDGHRFHSPNDIVIHSSGAMYFTDPAYGLEKGFQDPKREVDYQGVYRVDPDGKVKLMTKELYAPNGIGLSPDEKTLYVAQSHGPAPIYMAYPIRDNLDIGKGRILFDARKLAKTRRGSPDGLKVDKKGNLFATGPGGVLVITPQGKHLGTILTGDLTANCGFGDDGKTLYMTVNSKLARIRLKTTGLGF